ncbi:hypothetical protein Leryth_007374 [Lithospermum erythrorhizon]|nr:hypothetical protein Leryth_007374 [Lithospermum erythrorhizon]
MQPSTPPEMQSLNNALLQQFQMPFDTTSSHDDFLEQILSSPWAGGAAGTLAGDDHSDHRFNFDHHSQQTMLATKFRHHQINGGESGGAAAKALMLQQQLMLTGSIRGGDNDDGDASVNHANDSFVQAIFNGFGGSLGQTPSQPQPFNHLQAQNLVAAANHVAPPNGSTGAGAGGGASAQPRQPRVRARRGQATDPHSIAERLRRERIAERMKALQELVPNANKTDKASMLDEIIDYVKFLQLQVKVLVLEGLAAVAPLVADMSSEAGGDGGRAKGTQTASSSNNDNTMTITEHQVVKLMEEDMGTAMQYLQGKGLCLMPISLATAISTATRNTMNPTNFSTLNGIHPLLKSNGADTGGPSSPNMSVLSVQSATMANGSAEATESH